MAIFNSFLYVYQRVDISLISLDELPMVNPMSRAVTARLLGLRIIACGSNFRHRRSVNSLGGPWLQQMVPSGNLT